MKEKDTAMTSPAIPSPKEEAMEAARKIVESVGRDGERLKARAALCKFSGYDEDGVIAQYRTYLVARALLSSSSREEVLREALERISWNEPEGTPAQREATAALSQGE